MPHPTAENRSARDGKARRRAVLKLATTFGMEVAEKGERAQTVPRSLFAGLDDPKGEPALPLTGKGFTVSLITSPNLLCPLVKEEYDICYFMKMTSSDIQRTVLYCIGDYHKCEIYRRKVTLNSES